jgi:hypothetical protein
MAGNVSTRATRPVTAASTRGPSLGEAAITSDNGRPSMMNYGTASSSTTVWNART